MSTEFIAMKHFFSMRIFTEFSLDPSDEPTIPEHFARKFLEFHERNSGTFPEAKPFLVAVHAVAPKRLERSRTGRLSALCRRGKEFN